MMLHTFKKGRVVVSSTLTGQHAQVPRERVKVLNSKRGIEIEVMNPRITNLGSIGVALVNAVREGA